MKKTLLIFFFTIQVFSQIQVGVKSYDVKPSIEKVSETDAEYPGGINVFRSFFVTNFDFPSDLTVPLRMVITFTVCDDGSLCNFEVDSPNHCYLSWKPFEQTATNARLVRWNAARHA